MDPTSQNATNASAQPTVLTRYGRWILLAAILQYGISLAILLVASTSEGNMALWVGIIDVALVLTLVITSFLLTKAASQRHYSNALPVSYAVATYLPPILLMVMWIYADRLIWNTLLPGLAWRTWILLYNLPAAIAAWQIAGEVEGASHQD